MRHLIEDKSIGGVKREYVETDRKANVGDYVLISNFRGEVAQQIRKVSKLSIFKGDFRVDKPVYGEKYIDADVDEYYVLEPTNIVQIGGTRYQLSERKANVGEKVLAVNNAGDYLIGDVLTVINGNRWSDGTGVSVEEAVSGLYHEEYTVLIPVDSEQAEATPDIEGILANLINRVTSLERITGELVRAKSSVESQLNDAMRNIERQAQELEMEKAKVESNTKDIAFLDERTFEKPGKPEKSVEELMRDLSNAVKEVMGGGADV